jgi:hypothetical protein
LPSFDYLFKRIGGGLQGIPEIPGGQNMVISIVTYSRKSPFYLSLDAFTEKKPSYRRLSIDESPGYHLLGEIQYDRIWIKIGH